MHLYSGEHQGKGVRVVADGRSIGQVTKDNAMFKDSSYFSLKTNKSFRMRLENSCEHDE